MTRGLKVNNPGNIRISPANYVGEITPSADPAFSQFETIAYGYRAMFQVLRHYISNGLNTIQKIINTYAPPSENDTNAYINSVTKRTGISATAILDSADFTTLGKIVYAMAYVEQGVAPNQKDIDAAIAMLEGEKKKLKH
jgi:hypothetical protein